MKALKPDYEKLFVNYVLTMNRNAFDSKDLFVLYYFHSARAKGDTDNFPVITCQCIPSGRYPTGFISL